MKEYEAIREAQKQLRSIIQGRYYVEVSKINNNDHPYYNYYYASIMDDEATENIGAIICTVYDKDIKALVASKHLKRYLK